MYKKEDAIWEENERINEAVLPVKKKLVVHQIDIATWEAAKYMCMRCGGLLTDTACPRCDCDDTATS